MDNSSQIKIIPLTRKKLLQQALFKESPTNISLTHRKFTKHGYSSSHQIENYLKFPASNSSKVSPLREKDHNRIEKPLNVAKKVSFFVEQSHQVQETLVKLWKYGKMGGEIPGAVKDELQTLQTNLTSDHSKLCTFLTDLKAILSRQSTFPESLSPYLEEIICSIDLKYPLITPSLSLAEAESVLFISICRFSMKKIQGLRKIAFPSNDLQSLASALLTYLGEVDLNLNRTLTNHKSRLWDIFIEYSQNPGQLIQNLRKTPECIRNSFSEKTFNKVKNFMQKVEKLPECPEFFDLLTELVTFCHVVVEKAPNGQLNRLKRIEKFPDSNSSRSRTPATCRITAIPKIRHVRSNSKDFLTKRTPADSEKRVQFLQESRFNKRIIEKLAETLAGKMKIDPEYLLEVKKQNFSQYLEFKSEYIEIHKDFWTQETIKELESSDLLRINLDENLKFADAKKEAFFSYVCNEQLLSSLVEKVKTQILTKCKYDLNWQKHSVGLKGFSLKDNLLRNTQASKVYLHVDLNQIHDIIHKGLERKATVTQTHRKSVSAVTKFVNLHKDIKTAKRISSPTIYKPFKVRCHSNVLKIKFTKPKLITPCNNFIVKQLKRQEELSSPTQVAF